MFIVKVEHIQDNIREIKLLYLFLTLNLGMFKHFR